MPSVKPGEKRNVYVSRAIPEIKREHPEKDMKAVIGQAEGMFSDKWGLRGSRRRRGK